ncbi:MAG: TldD/PmbA family protein [Candidatus Sulfobium sp.]|jgi:PmbA protein
MKIDQGFAEEAVSTALKKGAEQAEVFIRSSRNIAIEVREQSVDSLKSARTSGYSVRIIRNGRLGFSYSTDAGEIGSVVDRALEAAEFSDEDASLGLPEGQPETPDVAVFDPEIESLSDDHAVRNVMLLEKAACDADGRVKRIRKAAGSLTVSKTVIVNSRSVVAAYASTSWSAQVTAIAEENNESQMGWDFGSGRFFRDMMFEEIGKAAARRAASLLGARKIAGGRADVILDSSVTVDFLGIFAASLSSEAVQKGRSLLAGRLGSKVMSDKVNLTDNGCLPGRSGSSPVDDEGVASRETVVVRGGVLENYLYNTYTARKGGALSTGNAVRGRFSSLPSVGITNLFLEPSSGGDPVPGQDMLGSVRRGLYVIDAMGVHTANPVSGEFSIGVSALWVEKGEIQYPVKEAVISGDIVDFFGKIRAAGDDLRFYGSVGGPTLLISDVDVSA